MAGTLAGSAPDQTVFCEHQRGTAIDQDLAGNSLAHIPNLGEGHFKAQAGRCHAQSADHFHGTGVVKIQTKVASCLHAAFLGNHQKCQIADENILHTALADSKQGRLQCFQFTIVDDAGRNCAYRHLANQKTGKLRICSQNMHRHIQHSRCHLQQLSGDLLPGGDLDGQFRVGFHAGVFAELIGLVELGLLMTGPLGSQQIQRIPPQCVDGSSGKGKSGRHIRHYLDAFIGCTAGFGQAGNQILLGQHDGPGDLRHGTAQRNQTAFRVGNSQRRSFRMDTHVEYHRHQAVFCSLVALANFLHPGLVITPFIPDAKHVTADIALVVTVRKTLAVKGIVQLLFHSFGHNAGVDSLAVNLGDGSHILRTLHASFQLQRSYAHLFQVLHIMHQAVILQTQRIPVLPAVIAVTLAAGLGAAAPVAGTATDGGA